MGVLSQIKVAEEAASFYDVLLQHSSNLIFVKDDDFIIRYANKAFLELYPPAEREKIIGAHTAENFSEEEAAVFFAEDRKAFEKGYSEIVEEIEDYTGLVRHFHTQKIRFTDETTRQPRILCICTDISRLVRREQELAKSNIALENFAKIAAHDFRSPLSALSSALESITHDKETKLGARALKYVALMGNCIDDLMQLVVNILETSKAEKSSDMEFTECALSTLLEEVKFTLDAKIKASNARILSMELPNVVVNKPLFRQLFRNLIENSLKYRSAVTPIIIIRHHIENNKHLFSIEDNGRGIPVEHRERIFGLYNQVNRHSSGYGIGLSLCKTAIQTHGGRIWLDEKYGPGCRICFCIPVDPKTA